MPSDKQLNDQAAFIYADMLNRSEKLPFIADTTAEEIELLCLLCAMKRLDRKDNPIDLRTAEEMGRLLFEKVWAPYRGYPLKEELMKARGHGDVFEIKRAQTSRKDLGSIIVEIAKKVGMIGGQESISAALVQLVFNLAVKMYRGEIEPRSGRQAILYAGILKRLGKVDENGNWIKQEYQE